MDKYDFSGYSNYYNDGTAAAPNEFLYQNTLKFYKYEDKIKNALFSSPPSSIICFTALMEMKQVILKKTLISICTFFNAEKTRGNKWRE
jgi:hypothetical protein